MASTRKRAIWRKPACLDECDERSCRCKWRLCCSSKPYWFRTILTRYGIQFWDLPLLRDHKAKFLASLTRQREILIAEVDLDLQENVRQNWPFFRDRRIDALEILQKSD
jgi:hypothetical protein